MYFNNQAHIGRIEFCLRESDQERINTGLWIFAIHRGVRSNEKQKSLAFVGKPKFSLALVLELKRLIRPNSTAIGIKRKGLVHTAATASKVCWLDTHTSSTSSSIIRHSLGQTLSSTANTRCYIGQQTAADRTQRKNGHFPQLSNRKY